MDHVEDARNRIVRLVGDMIASAKQAGEAGVLYPGPYLGEVERALDELVTAAVADWLAEALGDAQEELRLGELRWRRRALAVERVALGVEPHEVEVAGEDEHGPWTSRWDNGYRAPEVVRELEWEEPTLPEERLRQPVVRESEPAGGHVRWDTPAHKAAREAADRVAAAEAGVSGDDLHESLEQLRRGEVVPARPLAERTDEEVAEAFERAEEADAERDLSRHGRVVANPERVRAWARGVVEASGDRGAEVVKSEDDGDDFFDEENS